MERRGEDELFSDAKAKIVHQWVSLDFDWDAIGANKTEWIEKGWFIVENCAPSGIKQWQEDIYIAVPRWMPGVPSTLNKIVLNSQGHPILQPFPSIEYQNPNSTSGLKYVQDIEIDSLGRMWILDAGFLNIYQTQDKVFNPPRLIVLDLTDNNKVIVEFEFPSDIAQPFVTFLNDVVVDVANNFAYISNAAGNGGIYGYDLNTNQARFWTDVTTQAEPNNVFNISGVVYDLAPTPSDGIALTPDTDLLFYSPLAGVNLYSLSTSIFRNFSSSSQQIAATVVHRGQKLSQSDGITFANNGNLYYGNLANDAVNYWSLSSNSLSSSNQFTLVQNHQSMQWQDTFAFDNQGSILFMSNRLQLFPYLMDFTGNSGFNFHIFSVYINAKSYLYPLN